MLHVDPSREVKKSRSNTPKQTKTVLSMVAPRQHSPNIPLRQPSPPFALLVTITLAEAAAAAALGETFDHDGAGNESSEIDVDLTL
jgi:hypothetical protein